jgi:murein DD-endopeptidase MepM/ murein hydrolase activator NlpD
MRRDVDNEACPICGTIPYASERRVLVVNKTQRSYCSQSCLRVGVRTLQRARRRTLLRRWAALLSIALAVAGVAYLHQLVQRYLAHQRPTATTTASSPSVAAAAPPAPIAFGPQWPPTDEQWLDQLARATWVYPLPGPTRRKLVSSQGLFAADAKLPPRCRTAGRCGIELGGELWGEHVYAASAGVIDRLQRAEDAPGGVSVRIAHWGGVVFTHYVHLAAVPSRLAAGQLVRAGDVIGLVGDTGTKDAQPRLGFALSVRPSSALPEVYWDPEPLVASWSLQTPARGSVAGLVALDAPAEPVAGTPGTMMHAPLHRAR